jgi:hypothetical protein
MANERLYQFPSKASPVPADIIFAGDSAAAFDEVNITIAALIGAYPNLLSIGGLTLGANTYAYVNNSSVYTAGTITALGVSLLADSTVANAQGTLGYTATATASSFAGWDANVNLAANNFNTGYATTATAGASTTLTVGSAQQQYFTGTLNQTVVMPVTSTLVLGMSFLIVNISSGTVTINSSGGNAIATLGASQTTRVTCILTSGTTAASWSAATPVAGSGVVSSGTINDLAYYAASGTTVSALATAASGYLVTSAGGVPSIGNTGGALTLPSITFNSTTGIVGTTTNNNAAVGSVGQYLSTIVLTGSHVALTTATAASIVALPLPAGDFDVSGEAWFDGTATVNNYLIGISTTNNSITFVPSDSYAVANFYGSVSGIGGVGAPILPIGPVRISLASPTTVYLNVSATFSVGALNGYGKLSARVRR